MVYSISNDHQTINITSEQNSLPSERRFEQKLKHWVEAARANSEEDRHQAANRIREAYYQYDSHLYLNHLGLTSLPNDIFSELPYLQTVSLSHNPLRTLPGKLFSGMNNLHILDLSYTQLRTMPENVFTDLTNLQYLYLHHNALTALSENLFHGLIHLRELYLSNNQLTVLPQDTFSGMAKLQTLHLQHNQLFSLSESLFKGLTSLSYLHLSNNQLTSLPTNIFTELINLHTLVFNNNQLSTLPHHALAKLTNLCRLYLSNNQFTSFPDYAFASLLKLQKLTLSDNQLAALPSHTFAGLNNLQELYLFNNQLTALPENIFSELQKLKMLTLSTNHFTVLPKHTFDKLSSLNLLLLNGNPFIFKPDIQLPLGCRISLDAHLCTVKEEFQRGHTHMLDFLLTGEEIGGEVSARGLLKLKLMLQYANENIALDPCFSWKNSAALNQLFYQTSVLSSDAQNAPLKAQAHTVLKHYLETNNIKQFSAQALDSGLQPSQYGCFIFITENGIEGLTIAKDCYELNILQLPFAQTNSPNAALTNGVLVHKFEHEANVFKSLNVLKLFPFLNRAYSRALNK